MKRRQPKLYANDSFSRETQGRGLRNLDLVAMPQWRMTGHDRLANTLLTQARNAQFFNKDPYLEDLLQHVFFSMIAWPKAKACYQLVLSTRLPHRTP